MDNEKMVSFYKEDFTEDAWDILCDAFEVDPDEDHIYGLIMVEEDEDELDDDNDEFDDEEE